MQHSGGKLADAVFPIAYGIKHEQHYANLIAYKAKYPSPRATAALRDLLLLFVGLHMKCLQLAAGSNFTHLAIVPSTANRPGTHPLQDLTQSILSLPLISTTANPAYGSADRDFHRDRFKVRLDGPQPHRVLLIEDTWTTGSRVQALAHALKTAGTASVVTVVLGRHLKDEHQPSLPLLERARANGFTLARCAAAVCLAG